MGTLRSQRHLRDILGVDSSGGGLAPVGPATLVDLILSPPTAGLAVGYFGIVNATTPGSLVTATASDGTVLSMSGTGTTRLLFGTFATLGLKTISFTELLDTATNSPHLSTQTVTVLPVGVALAADLQGRGTLGGTLQQSLSLAGIIGGTGRLAGIVENTVFLSRALLGVGQLTGTLTQTAFLSDTLSGRGTLGGALTQALTLSGALSGKGTLVGNIGQDVLLNRGLTGTGLLSGTLIQTLNLTGNVVASGLLAGTLSRTNLLVGPLTGVGLLGGTLSQSLSFTGALTGVGLLGGTISRDNLLVGALTGSGVLGGTLSQAMSLTGGVVGSGLLAGALRQDLPFSGALVGSGVLTGLFGQAVGLVGAIVGFGLAVGTLSQSLSFVGSVAGSGILTGTPTIAAGGEEAETAALVARLTATPSTARRAAINTLFATLKNGPTSGTNILAKLDVLQIYAAENSADALINWLGASFPATLVNAPAFTANDGFLTNGTTSYIDSGYNPGTAGGLMTQDSVSTGYWATTHYTGANAIVGEFDGSDGITTRNSTAAATYRVNNTANVTTSYVTFGYGIFAVNRSSSTAVQMYRDGVSINTSSQASVAPNNANIWLGRIIAYSSVGFRLFFAGATLTAAEHADLSNALHTYYSAISAVFKDNFNRANEDLSANANWTFLNGLSTDLAVSGNQVLSNSADVTGSAVGSPSTGSPNHYAQGKWSWSSVNAGPFICVQLTDANNMIGGRYVQSSTALQLYKRVGSTLTLLGSLTQAINQGDLMRVEVVNGFASLFINGVLKVGPFAATGVPASNRGGLLSRIQPFTTWIDDYETGPM